MICVPLCLIFRFIGFRIKELLNVQKQLDASTNREISRIFGHLIIKGHGDCQAKKGALQEETGVMKIKQNLVFDFFSPEFPTRGTVS
jgi:hypothetical protein